MSQSKSERRKDPRFPAKLPTYYMAARRPKVEDWTTTRNLSRGGLCLLVDRPLPNGTRLHLELDLPDRIFLTFIQGEVVWSERRPTTIKGETYYRAGIRIREFGPFDERRYTEFIDELTASPALH